MVINLRRLYTSLKTGNWKYYFWVQKTRKLNIDFKSVSLENLKLNAERCNHHDATSLYELAHLLDELKIRNNDNVIDLGCGKGAAMCALARAPFKLIAGVELSLSLLQIADNNLRLLGIRNYKLYNYDAGIFTDLDSYTWIFMFNPFPDVVVNEVLGNLIESVARNPRKVYVLYRHPVCHSLLIKHGFREVRKWEQAACNTILYVYQ